MRAPLVLVSLAFVASGACAVDVAPAEPARSALPLVASTPISACRWPGVVALGQRCTGLLVHETVVVYAAHCGTQFESVTLDGEELPVRRCGSYPGWRLGSDIAYCVLDRPATHITFVPPALGCEAERVAPGAELVLVGLGQAGLNEEFGTKREALARILEVGDELVVGGGETGTCRGDSGGPAFIDVAAGTGASAWRVAGVLSNGQKGCMAGTSYYTPIAPFVPWLERETGADLSPCGDADGRWRPTRACRDGAPLDDTSCSSGAASAWSATCGARFDPERAGASPPNTGAANAGCSLATVTAGSPPPAPLAAGGILLLLPLLARRRFAFSSRCAGGSAPSRRGRGARAAA